MYIPHTCVRLCALAFLRYVYQRVNTPLTWATGVGGDHSARKFCSAASACMIK